MSMQRTFAAGLLAAIASFISVGAMAGILTVKNAFPGKMVCTNRSLMDRLALARATAIGAMLGVALLVLAPSARAQPTAGASCGGPGCRAEDGRTAGGSCYGPYCVAGGAGTAGGTCIGNNCQAGNGGTGGGDCVGEGCKAGRGGTTGGRCYGKGCTSGNRADCYGEGCRPGPGGRANPDKTSNVNMGCCMAWQAGALRREVALPELSFRRRDDPNAGLPAAVQQCLALQEYNSYRPGASGCPAQTPDRRYVVVPPMPTDARPEKMPAPPTPFERFERRWEPDPRCQYDCQSWNPASNSCVGPRMNGCAEMRRRQGGGS